jgi:hypothetical protein
MTPPILTAQQAFEICAAHEIENLLANEEEHALLEENNPDLLAAYKAPLALAKEAL